MSDLKQTRFHTDHAHIFFFLIIFFLRKSFLLYCFCRVLSCSVFFFFLLNFHRNAPQLLRKHVAQNHPLLAPFPGNKKRRGVRGRGWGIKQKCVYSRHGVISCPDVNVVCVFFLSLSLSLMNFQRSGGDFTVTFSDSYVSHYMWAGGRERAL